MGTNISIWWETKRSIGHAAGVSLDRGPLHGPSTAPPRPLHGPSTAPPRPLHGPSTAPPRPLHGLGSHQPVCGAEGQHLDERPAESRVTGCDVLWAPSSPTDARACLDRAVIVSGGSVCPFVISLYPSRIRFAQIFSARVATGRTTGRHTIQKHARVSAIYYVDPRSVIVNQRPA
jgi:hypothetical protein